MALLGSITLNEIQILEVDTSPILDGIDADTGSLAIVTDGSKIFLKTGALATDWSPINSLDRAEYSLRMTAIQTRNANSYLNVTELITPVLPVGFYTMAFYGVAQSTATSAGMGVRLGAVTATISTPTSIKWRISQGGNGTDKNYEYDQVTPTDNLTSTSVSPANSNFAIHGGGLFEVTVAGTVAIQFRSENTTTVSLRPPSSLFIKAL